MRVGIVGGGEIARLLIEHIARGELGDTCVVAMAGRSAESRGGTLARKHGIRFVIGVEALCDARPDVVVEAASHQAVREYGQRVLGAGIAFIVLSGGALCDDALRGELESAAQAGNALLYVPSGGIGGLDALKAACEAGVDEVEIAVTKPVAAWRGIPYVESLDLDLAGLKTATVLFEGRARDGVPLFPANVNIAAVLSMAGVGFDRTRLKVVADPGITLNTHYITIRGKSGTVNMKFESVPFPDNPKTAMLAAYSAIAAVKQYRSRVRYGT